MKPELLAFVTMTLLDNSENFVKFLGWYADERHVGIAMEYIALGHLGGLKRSQSQFCENDVRDVVTSPCRSRDDA